MNPLYNTGIRAYRLAARLAALRSRKVATMLRGQKTTLDHLINNAPEGGFDIWFHVASLGEFEQARPLIEKLRAKYPKLKILLSFFSPSGYEVRKNYGLVDMVTYLPFDTPQNVREFLDAASPHVAVFVKYEFWGNYLQQLRKRGSNIFLISAIFRPKQRFFRKAGGGMFRKMLRCFDRLFVQDEASLKLLEGIGVNNVEIAGDTRFDRVNDIMLKGAPVPGMEAFVKGAEHTIVVGSSWQPDEDIYIPRLHRHENIKAVIAPHEFDEKRLALLLSRLGEDKAVLYSKFTALYEKDKALEAEELMTGAKYVIIDCFGLLSRIYRYGDISYVGGGFGVGIHNINEAAVYGRPVIFGPKYHKFKEAVDLIACGGAFSVAGEQDFDNVFERLVSDSCFLKESGLKASEYIKSHLGATDKILAKLCPTIGNR